MRNYLSFIKASAWILTFMLLLMDTAFAGTVWQGSISNDWHTPCNWSLGVPDANDEVAITAVVFPNVYPVITATAFSRGIGIDPGASLTIAVGGTLYVSRAQSDGIDLVGSIENNGTLNINNVGYKGISMRSGTVFQTGEKLISEI